MIVFSFSCAGPASGEEGGWDGLQKLLDKGFRIVGASDKYVYIQKEAEAYYCYGNPSKELPWLCWDMRNWSPEVFREMHKEPK